MTTTNGTTPRTLLPHHLAELRASGLTDETIQAAGIHSESNATRLARLLGWDKWPKRRGSAMVFPFHDADGANGYCQVKPDNPRRNNKGAAVKYESPRGQPPRLYIPPGVAAKLESNEPDLFITEGVKKALALTQAGFSAVGLAGVSSFYRDKKSCRLLPELERAEWKRRKTFIVFDSDAADNPNVADAERQLAAKLAALGAVVKVIRLPAGPAGEGGEPVKQGVDDFLVRSGAAALHKLREEAIEPEPPQDGDGKPDARTLDPAETADKLLECEIVDGASRLRFWRGAWWRWDKGRYRWVQNTEVAARIVGHVNHHARHVTTNITGNLVNQVRAKALLSGTVEPPTFLGDAPRDANGEPWKAADVLVAKNGLVHLPSLVNRQPHFHEATPRFFSLAALDYDFAIDAPPPVAWLAFLNQLWPADEDEGKSIATLQEWFGYCMTPDTSQQKILALIGPKRSGKGTICRIMRAVVGTQNCCGPTLASFGQNFGLWPLLGKLLAVISDARLSGRSDQQVIVERLLSISGEDELTIDRKNLEPVTCKLNTRIVVASNELPRLTDSSGALDGRLILLRLTKSFYGAEDTELADKLLAELPSIALWSIGGWKQLRNRKRFVQPDSGKELLCEMSDLSSPVGAFVDDCCTVDAAASVERATIYQAYLDWCKEAGRHHVEDAAGFGRALRARVPTLRSSQPRTDGRRVRAYLGIRLRADF